MIHWISNSRVSLQRLGFCRIAARACEDRGSRGELSHAVREAIQVPLKVQASDELAQWVRARPKGRSHKETGGKISVALQDRWVFEHPSQSGWLLDLAHEEYFEKMGLPFLLGLLDEECQRTDLGELLALLDTEVGGTWSAEGIGNPLVLSRDARAVLLYAILRADGDFIIPYMHDLLRLAGKAFTYLEAGRNVPAVMVEMLERLERSSYTTDDREKINDLKRAQQKISENIERNVETMGSGSRREQTILPRLEWLVDIGLLKKTRGGVRQYVLCDQSSGFVKEIYSAYVSAAKWGYPEEAVDKVLDSGFFRLAHLLLYQPMVLGQPPDIIEFISPAYRELRSPTGYCIGRPLLLLSHLRRWEAGEHVVCEYENARGRLEEAYQEEPDRFYFTTSRFGEDFQIRLEEQG